jgi:type II secretory pathway pseudopilin PulG
MKIFPKNRLRVADAKEMSHQGERAFTMVEIAIAIGVIGFALVAIIGILPTGMNSQKDNREDTVISQDAPFFLEAIRNGAPVTNYQGTNFLAVSAEGLDFLTNYVQMIQFNYYYNGTNTETISYPPIGKTNFSSGLEIIGLLSTPQTNYYNVYTPGSPIPSSPAYFSSNYFDVTAYVRALSGPASAQQFGANSGPSAFMAFTYKMEVTITPFNSFAPATTNFNAPNLDSNQYNICYNRWLEATPGTQGQLPLTSPVAGTYPVYTQGPPLSPGAGGYMLYNLYDVRLRFSWPVNMNGTNVISVGTGRQTYRTLVSAALTQSLANGVPGWFFQPQFFTNVIPPDL